MEKHILFIQGAGANAHAEDAKLVGSLTELLGSSYKIHYPKMKNEDDAKYEEWAAQIQKEIDGLSGEILVIAHSVGASVLIKFFTDSGVLKKIKGIYLIAAPFWGGEKGWKYEGYEKLMLKKDAKISKDVAVFFFHAEDDETVPFDHLKLYGMKFPQATIRKIKTGGHQLGNDMSKVAESIGA